MVGYHDICQVEGDDFAGKGGELDVQVDAVLMLEYVIYSRVTSLSVLISAMYSGCR